MKRNQINSIIVHTDDKTDFHALADKVSGFHAEVIERRLVQSNLTTEQKIKVIENIIKNLKSREINSIIK